MSHLTIAYGTSREEPKLEWFVSSLIRQYQASNPIPLTLVVVDFRWNKKRLECLRDAPFEVVYVIPKPSVWQGEFRLTSTDYWAASNSRNTALCHAKDGWIAYVDDLSVAMPGWLDAVKDSMKFNGITLGAYKKVNNLNVQNGVAVGWKEFPSGIDSRWNKGKENDAVPVSGELMFGCSCVIPVEALLTINGWPEFVDGMSFEDVLTGICLENAGYKFRYDRRLLTFESEELHHVGTVMKRCDKGVSPNDKSHAALNIARQSKYFPNYFGEGGIRALRQHILNGGEFPVVGIPDSDWYDKQPLSEM